jgi:MoxR-like ATPase
MPRPLFLARMGLHGLDRLQLPILCALVNAVAVLLIGRHGSGKTMLVQRLAAALGAKFKAYEAHLALFEDLVGFPDPASLRDGKDIHYLRTPLSAWDAVFLLVDELSRADPAMANKWMEVIFARTLMGLPLSARWAFAAMNPADYLGCGPLDEALAGRFAVVLQVPSFADMDPADQERVIASAGGWGDDPGEDLELQGLIERARGGLDAVRCEQDSRVCRYVREFARAAAAEGHLLDGRRLGMIKDNLFAGLALREAGYVEGTEEELFSRVTEVSLPDPAFDPDFEPILLRTAHTIAWGTVGAGTDGRPGLIDVLGDTNPRRALRRYLELAPTLSPDEHDRAVERFQSEYESAPLGSRHEAAATIVSLIREVCEAHQDFPIELVARLLGWGRGFLGLDREMDAPMLELSGLLGGGLALSRPEDVTAARLALQTTLPRIEDDETEHNAERAARNLPLLRAFMAHCDEEEGD